MICSSSIKSIPWGSLRYGDEILVTSVRVIFRGDTAMQISKIAILFLRKDATARRQLFGENLTASVRPKAATASRTCSGAAYSSCMSLLRHPHLADDTPD